MSFMSDLRILWHLLSAKAGENANHQERLEAFYSGQRDAYDSFRNRLLHGREELMRILPLPEKGGTLLDMGGGTGSNIEALGIRLETLKSASVLDLCPSLLQVANKRIQQHGWTNVDAIHGDATKYIPPCPVDVITFSYSLTMIPDWFKAIRHAWEILKPGGILGVVDFYIPRKFPEIGKSSISPMGRVFWPAWFGYDNVFLSPDHLPFLADQFDSEVIEERRGKVPYMLWLKAPYYLYIGRKPYVDVGA